MSKIRFTPWIVFACIGTLAGCTSGEGGPAGNTELNVVIPNNAGQSSAPGAFDIQVVEYTIVCDDGTNAPLDPIIDSVEPTFDDDITISGVLEVLDTASSGVTIQDFGPDLTDVYVWQGFMDLPPTVGCTVQLRARDADGEVICTADETFDIYEDDETKVNVLMYCGISFQAPVGMLDLDGDFSFNVANFCPDLFVLNCIDSELNVRTVEAFPGVFIDVLATACQVRFRDGDSQCGNSCDPQVCTPTPAGLSCAPDPAFVDPPVSTVVVCSSPSGACAISCDGINPAASCTFTGDTLGGVGDPAPSAGAPGEGGFFVSCATVVDPVTGDTVPAAPGDNITCTAQTDDGDTDCRKTKVVDLTVIGNSACQDFGDPAAQCDDGNECTIESCDDTNCDGTALNCCVNTPTPGVACTTSGGGPGTCNPSGTCDPSGCASNADCDPGNACNAPDTCDIATGACVDGGTINEDGTCDLGAGPGTCQSGACVSLCAGPPPIVCDDSNECTDDGACDTATGSCPPPVNDDNNSCTSCPGGGACACESGVCVDSVLGPFSNANTCDDGVEPPPVNCDYGCNALANDFGFEAILTVNPDDTAVGGAPTDIVFDGEFTISESFIQGAGVALGAELLTANVGASPNSLPVTALSGATGVDTVITLPAGLVLDLTADPDGNTIAGPFPLPFVATTGNYTLAASGSDNCFNLTNTVAFNLTVTEFDLGGGPVGTFIPANFACQPVEQIGINYTNIDCLDDAICIAAGSAGCDLSQNFCLAEVTAQADAGQVCFTSP